MYLLRVVVRVFRGDHPFKTYLTTGSTQYSVKTFEGQQNSNKNMFYRHESKQLKKKTYHIAGLLCKVTQTNSVFLGVGIIRREGISSYLQKKKKHIFCNTASTL